MTLDEAIRVLRQHNVTGASVLRITKGKALEKDLLAQMLDSCEQLISEKAEYKRLLKAAVEDMYNSVNDVHCKYCSKWHTDQCQGTSHLDCYVENKFKWRHADKALALIGEDTNVPASADDTNDGGKTEGR